MLRSSSRMLVAAAATAAAAVALLSSGVEATESLTFVRPVIWAAQFNYNGVEGQMYAEPSLFGLPTYNADVQALLKLDSEKNENGCLPYSPDFVPQGQKGPVPVIALTKRGNCTFGVKAMRAQEGGASALIVYDDQIVEPERLPKMSGGDLTRSLLIPGMLVTLNDGLKLRQAVINWEEAVEKDETTSPYYKGAVVSMFYSLIAPDDRVEWDLFTYPDEVSTAPFIAAFQPVVRALGDRALFTPHFRIIDGDMRGCLLDKGVECSEANKAALPCGNQCTNCGRYCRIDPNGSLEKPPNGADVVRQSVIQKCLYWWAQNENQPLLWWQYAEARQALNCVEDANAESCTSRALSKANIPKPAIEYINKECKGDMGAYTDEDNDVLERELQWQYDWLPPTSPYLYVNNYTYNGGFVCGTPASVSSCGPLSVMCAGYLPGTAPEVCNPNGCDNGIARDACGVCGGSATDDSNCEAKSKFPTGAVIGVIILCCVLIGGGVYYFMRRREKKMRDDIDSLLKQYLPLDGQAGINGGSGGNKSPGGASGAAAREQNTGLRLIGNLDVGSDEPTDL